MKAVKFNHVNGIVYINIDKIESWSLGDFINGKPTTKLYISDSMDAYTLLHTPDEVMDMIGREGKS